jgi:hypothetical protein
MKMSNSNLPVQISAAESALIQGDLSKLTPDQCVQLYNSVCESVGLNPLTKPFEYLFLNGKKILYAKKDATDQLRKIHGISVTKIDTKIESDLLEVTVVGSDKTGRTDAEIGVVNVAGLKGEALANAKMKGLTKAKRRLTLSLSGLGLLDETEIADMPREVVSPDFNNDPFGKKQAALDGPSQSAEVVSQESAPADEGDLGSYVVKFGQKHKGKELREMDPFDLDGYMKWLKDSAAKSGKALSGDAAELCEVGEAYLKTLETRA